MSDFGDFVKKRIDRGEEKSYNETTSEFRPIN